MKSTFLLLAFFLAACSTPKEKTDSLAQQEEVATPADSSLHHVIIPADGNAGFGYDIYVNGKLYIHQPTIPAVPGNLGFSTEENAGKAAALVEHKIRNNILPPAVSVEELDSLGVLK